MTSAVARPATTGVDENTMQTRSASRVSRRGARRILLDRLGLTGERGLVDAQVALGDDSRVGRHPVAGLEHEDVAHDDLGGVDHPHLAVAQHARARAREPAQRVERRLGAVLLEHADDDVRDDDEHDDDGVEDLACEQRDHARAREQVHHRVRDLGEDQLRDRGTGLDAELVGAAGGKALGGIGGREPDGGRDAELLGCGLGVERMPRSRGGIRGRSRHRSLGVGHGVPFGGRRVLTSGRPGRRSRVARRVHAAIVDDVLGEAGLALSPAHPVVSASVAPA